jgi:hypothetical protein
MLERASRALLVRMGVHQGGVKVDAQRPRRCRTRRPRPRTDPRQRRPQRRHPSGIGSDLPEDPPRSRRRADPAEQPRLIAQAGQVAHTVTPIGQHDDQVTQHRAAVVGMAATGADKAKVGAAAKLLRELEPVGQLGQQYHPGVAADAVRVGGDIEAGTSVGSLHRQGDPPCWGMGPPSSRILPGREGPLPPDSNQRSVHTKSRLGLG